MSLGFIKTKRKGLNPADGLTVVCRGELLLAAAATRRGDWGSALLGASSASPMSSPHRHRSSVRIPTTGIDSVGRWQWRCGRVSAGRFCRLR
ncbi:hypothetical protein SO802_023878 [Lithocarpus litseifolius]|uniref:Uncharacterized protein n=1 Tax=Lithocarpus litseifolius TaxID=425828 RepID=A0AAW2C7D9_9ROSI